MSFSGTAAFAALFVCFASFSSAQAPTQEKLKGVVQFVGTNGSDAVSDLIQLPNGNFLGVTLKPSFEPKPPSTIYELKPGGVIQTLYLLAADGSQGELLANSFGNNGVMQASDGNIYGVMGQGGTNGYGLVYRLTLPSAFKTLHNFTLATTDGANPGGKLVQALDGNLYGVASGGIGDAGIIFRVGLDGSFAVVYDFGSTNIGAFPGSLALHPNGLLYGVLTSVIAPSGNIFQFDPISGKVQILAPGTVSNVNPPVIGVDGGLYFIVEPDPNCSTCFALLVRYGTDGSGPVTVFNFPHSANSAVGSLMQASDGSFFGAGATSAFQANPVTQELNILPFPIGAAYATVGEFVEGASGSLVGAIPVTASSPRLGALMALAPPLPKPQPSIIGFYPTTASIGATVTVLGNFFVGSTGVSIGGATATFSVEGSGAIQFVVPGNAKSSQITIFNQGGSATTLTDLTVQ